MSGQATTPIPAGLLYKESMIVEARHTVPEVAAWKGFADMPEVFATAMMIGFVEQTCIQALRPFLTPHHGTVGVSVDITHVAPTPIGGTVTASVKLVEQKKRTLSFEVAVYDDHGLVGEGTHDRAVINTDRFNDAVDKRKAANLERP